MSAFLGGIFSMNVANTLPVDAENGLVALRVDSTT